MSGGQDRLAVAASILPGIWRMGTGMSLHGPQAAHQPYGESSTCPRPAVLSPGPLTRPSGSPSASGLGSVTQGPSGVPFDGDREQG